MTTWTVAAPRTTTWTPANLRTTAWAIAGLRTTAWTALTNPVAVTNFSFETALDPVLDWTLEGTAPYGAAQFVRYASANANDGSYVLRCELLAVGPNYYGHPFATHVAIPTTIDGYYRVRARVRVEDTTGTPLGSAGLECDDGDGNLIGVTSLNLSALTTTWQTLQVEFEATAAALVIILYENTLPNNTRQYPCLFDNVTVSAMSWVTAGTPWTVAGPRSTIWTVS